MRLQETSELLDRSLVAPLAHEHGATLARVKIAEHRHVVLPAAEARVIDPDALGLGQVLRLDRQIDVVVHDPPDLRVVLADQPADRLHRHLPHQRHHQRLEQQREVRTLPRPRHLHLPGPML